MTTKNKTKSKVVEQPKITVSKHCAERYCQRVLKLTEESKIDNYILKNHKEINEAINTIYKEGDYFYQGAIKIHPITDIYLKDSWVLIVDPNSNHAITLYEVDLGLGSEFNKIYADRVKETIDEKKAELEKIQKTQSKTASKYTKLINTNNNKIAALEEKIKALQEQNEASQKAIKDSQKAVSNKHNEIIDIIECFLTGERL